MRSFTHTILYSVLGIVLAIGLLFFLFPGTHWGIFPSSSLTRLMIPVLNINTPIKEVGITKSGELDAPKRPNEVAWFNLGPLPGETGSAVIVGHQGWKNNKPSIFDNLHALKKGDKIFVEDVKGKTVTFAVREIRVYDKDADTSGVFLSESGAHLNLITCTGDWNESKKTYDERLVVFADAI